MKPARNAPCTCGSGKKYKHCHGAEVASKNARWSVYAMLLVGTALLAGVGFFLYDSITGAPADGRIWSAEHGHWHDAEGRELGASGNAPAPNTPAAQPPGPPPPGKVWSTEHGHWHDA